jgi:hypothetical protein
LSAAEQDREEAERHHNEAKQSGDDGDNARSDDGSGGARASVHMLAYSSIG